jgi:uncharacterized membrane protein YeaQ/YmgE (transglycosylase-associated protein family)
MVTLGSLLAVGVSLKWGDQPWAFGANVMVYLVLAVVVSGVAESFLGWRLPLGMIGAILSALVGAWILTKILIITGIGDLIVFGVPLIRALLGAIFLVILWYLLTYRLWRRPRLVFQQQRYSRRPGE